MTQFIASVTVVFFLSPEVELQIIMFMYTGILKLFFYLTSLTLYMIYALLACVVFVLFCLNLTTISI